MSGGDKGLLVIVLLGFVFVGVVGMTVLGLIGGVAPGETAEKISSPNPTGYCPPTTIPKQSFESIKKNTGIYQEAAKVANLPWQMIAGVHFRETNNSRVTPKTNTDDGVYQIITKNYPYPAGETLTDEQFLQETIDAAKFIQGKVENKLTTTTNDANLIKDAFWGYNGRAYGSFDKSPYVMNNFDENHENMKMDACDEGVCYKTDTRNGAYTTFIILLNSCQV